MKKLVVVFTFLFMSCNSIKEHNSALFFKDWRNDSKLFLSKIESKTKLQQELREIINIELSTYNFPNYKKDFPRLEYMIFPENIRVSMYKYERNRGLDVSNEEGQIFVDSLFKNNIGFDKLKALILTEKYESQLPKEKLPYGFGSYYEGVNKQNAKVILERPPLNKDEHYTLPIRIPYVEFNQSLDTVHLFIYNLRQGTEKRYIKLNKKWKLDKIFETT